MSTRAERKRRAKRLCCPACGLYKARHYVPPSNGEKGFYICRSWYA